MISQISDEEISEAKEILSAHVVNSLTRESALESGLFAIASAGTPWDGFPTRLVRELRRLSGSTPASYSVLSDQHLIRKLAKDLRWRFHHGDRFSSLIGAFEKRSENWWEAVVNADEAYRESQTNSKSPEKIDYMAYKTFSFWHLCLGGKSLATLDIHVRRQLNERLNFGIDERYVTHQKRQSTERATNHVHKTLAGGEEEIVDRTYQRVSVEPASKVYCEIERQMRNYFVSDSRFVVDGKTDMALVTSLLWWGGARRESANQLYLDGFEKPHAALPHAN